MIRPAGVPEGAWWEEDDGEWVFGPLDADEEKHGHFDFWRADGTKCAENEFAHGVVRGAFRRFHENGEVSQSGSFDDAGELHGTRSWICCDAPSSENTRPPGASEAVWRSEMDYVHGKPVATRHFDRAGNRVRPDGRPYPQRPEAVDARAELIEDEWVLAEVDGKGVRNGARRVWTAAGTLAEDGSWKDGERDGRFRWWDEDGALERMADLRAGRKDGRWWTRVPPGTYADPRIRQEKGGFHEDFAVGPWNFSDERGHTVRVLDFGVPVAVSLESPVFEDRERAAQEWSALGDELRRQRQMGEAICAWARAAAASRDSSMLAARLVERTACLAESAAAQSAEEVLSSAGDSPAALLNALVRGAAPAPILRALAVL
ncbi:MAG TPA: thiol reductase thioredoxin, partial [bacterium]|nr:thiol reductase thioredoxin [bacterium]